MKKINKYIKYMLFAVVLCIVTTGNVFASCSGETKACRECEYSFKYISDTVTVKYKAVDDGNGDIILRNEMSGSKGFAVSGNDIFGKVFKDKSGKKLYCPDLYYKLVMPDNRGGTINIKIASSKKDGYGKFTKGADDGNNLNISEKKKKSAMCEFTTDIKNARGQILINNEKFNFNITEGSLPTIDTTGKFGLKFSDISFNDLYKDGKCIYAPYVVCQATKNTDGIQGGIISDYAPECTISKEQIIFSEKTEITEPIDPDNGDDKDRGGITFGDGDGDCKYVLGQILDDIQNIFDIVKILAPILVIVFGTLDFVKATIAMDDKGMKTAMNKFPRRLIAAAALFFLPYIINLLLSMPGLEIENAVCGISKVVFKSW